MAVEDRPSLIICRTHIAFGAPNKQDSAGAHGSPLGEEEVRLTKERYGWPTEPPFLRPGRGARALPRDDPARRAGRARVGRALGGLPRRPSRAGRGARGDLRPPRAGAAARAAQALRARRRRSPRARPRRRCSRWPRRSCRELVGGAADLAPSTLTLIDGGGDVERGSYGGRNLHFGIREHAMGAIVNGLALSGLRAYGATFLIFSDYMKGAVRLAALMELPSIFVYTHDSIGARRGRPDPPADRAARGAARDAEHQRRAPGRRARDGARLELRAARHGDADGARALAPGAAGARPGADPRRRDRARRLRPARRRRRPGAGPDRHRLGGLAVPGRRRRAGRRRASRRASSACRAWTASSASAAGERERVLGPPGTPRVAVEAASPFGWDRWIGRARRGHRHAHVRRLRARRPAVYAHFGITAAAVVEQARALLRAPERSTHGKRTAHRQRQRLAALVAAGTAPWLDQIRRGLIASGELARLRDEYSLRGVTSNPAIFEQAILGSSDYDDELRELAHEGLDARRALRAHGGRRPPGRRRRAARRSTTSTATASSRSRSCPTAPTTPRARSRRRATTGRASTART